MDISDVLLVILLFWLPLGIWWCCSDRTIKKYEPRIQAGEWKALVWLTFWSGPFLWCIVIFQLPITLYRAITKQGKP
jgi:hypothetical protein